MPLTGGERRGCVSGIARSRWVPLLRLLRLLRLTFGGSHCYDSRSACDCSPSCLDVTPVRYLVRRYAREWECRRELARVVPRRRCAAGPCVRACPASRTVYPRDVRYAAKGVYIAPVRLRPRLPGVAMPMIHTALRLGISLYLERRVPASAQFLSRDNRTRPPSRPAVVEVG